MNQHNVEPTADVRAFLPRPGEPVETYAERLRALHRDLTLVLQAVERGLSAGETRAEPIDEPGFEGDIAAVRPEGDEPIEVHGIAPTTSERVPASAVRVEVLPARSDAPRRSSGEHAEPWSEDTPIERRAPLRPVPIETVPEPPRFIPAEPAPVREATPPRMPELPPPPSPLPPAAETPQPEQPPFYARALPPWVVAAVLAGWLTIVALLIALLVDR